MTSRPRRPGLAEMAAAPIDAEDERVLRLIAGIRDRTDPVPTGLVERIQFGITLDALHAEIAELQRSGDLTGVRSEGTDEVRTVTFASTSRTAMVTMTPSSSGRVRIDGWIAPGDGVRVELRMVGESLWTTADPDGRFVFIDVARGLAQFVLRPPGDPAGDPVITPSIEI